jgi:hypothetical protein
MGKRLKKSLLTTPGTNDPTLSDFERAVSWLLKEWGLILPPLNREDAESIVRVLWDRAGVKELR